LESLKDLADTNTALPQTRPKATPLHIEGQLGFNLHFTVLY